MINRKSVAYGLGDKIRSGRELGELGIMGEAGGSSGEIKYGYRTHPAILANIPLIEPKSSGFQSDVSRVGSPLLKLASRPQVHDRCLCSSPPPSSWSTKTKSFPQPDPNRNFNKTELGPLICMPQLSINRTIKCDGAPEGEWSVDDGTIDLRGVGRICVSPESFGPKQLHGMQLFGDNRQLLGAPNGRRPFGDSEADAAAAVGAAGGHAAMELMRWEEFQPLARQLPLGPPTTTGKRMAEPAGCAASSSFGPNEYGRLAWPPAAGMTNGHGRGPSGLVGGTAGRQRPTASESHQYRLHIGTMVGQAEAQNQNQDHNQRLLQQDNNGQWLHGESITIAAAYGNGNGSGSGSHTGQLRNYNNQASCKLTEEKKEEESNNSSKGVMRMQNLAATQLEMLMEEFFHDENDKINLSYYLNQFETNQCDLSELLTNLLQNLLIKLPNPMIKYKLLHYIKLLYIEPKQWGQHNKKEADRSNNNNNNNNNNDRDNYYNEDVDCVFDLDGPSEMVANHPRANGPGWLSWEPDNGANSSLVDPQDERWITDVRSSKDQLDLRLFEAMTRRYLVASNVLIYNDLLASSSNNSNSNKQRSMAEQQKRRRQRRALELQQLKQQRPPSPPDSQPFAPSCWPNNGHQHQPKKTNPFGSGAAGGAGAETSIISRNLNGPNGIAAAPAPAPMVDSAGCMSSCRPGSRNSSGGSSGGWFAYHSESVAGGQHGATIGLDSVSWPAQCVPHLNSSITQHHRLIKLAPKQPTTTATTTTNQPSHPVDPAFLWIHHQHNNSNNNNNNNHQLQLQPVNGQSREAAAAAAAAAAPPTSRQPTNAQPNSKWRPQEPNRSPSKVAPPLMDSPQLLLVEGCTSISATSHHHQDRTATSHSFGPQRRLYQHQHHLPAANYNGFSQQQAQYSRLISASSLNSLDHLKFAQQKQQHHHHHHQQQQQQQLHQQSTTTNNAREVDNSFRNFHCQAPLSNFPTNQTNGPGLPLTVAYGSLSHLDDAAAASYHSQLQLQLQQPGPRQTLAKPAPDWDHLYPQTLPPSLVSPSSPPPSPPAEAACQSFSSWNRNPSSRRIELEEEEEEEEEFQPTSLQWSMPELSGTLDHQDGQVHQMAGLGAAAQPHLRPEDDLRPPSARLHDFRAGAMLAGHCSASELDLSQANCAPVGQLELVAADEDHYHHHHNRAQASKAHSERGAGQASVCGSDFYSKYHNHKQPFGLSLSQRERYQQQQQPPQPQFLHAIHNGQQVNNFQQANIRILNEQDEFLARRFLYTDIPMENLPDQFVGYCNSTNLRLVPTPTPTPTVHLNRASSLTSSPQLNLHFSHTVTTAAAARSQSPTRQQAQNILINGTEPMVVELAPPPPRADSLVSEEAQLFAYHASPSPVPLAQARAMALLDPQLVGPTGSGGSKLGGQSQPPPSSSSLHQPGSSPSTLDYYYYHPHRHEPGYLELHQEAANFHQPQQQQQQQQQQFQQPNQNQNQGNLQLQLQQQQQQPNQFTQFGIQPLGHGHEPWSSRTSNYNNCSQLNIIGGENHRCCSSMSVPCDAPDMLAEGLRATAHSRTGFSSPLCDGGSGSEYLNFQNNNNLLHTLEQTAAPKGKNWPPPLTPLMLAPCYGPQAAGQLASMSPHLYNNNKNPLGSSPHHRRQSHGRHRQHHHIASSLPTSPIAHDKFLPPFGGGHTRLASSQHEADGSQFGDYATKASSHGAATGHRSRRHGRWHLASSANNNGSPQHQHQNHYQHHGQSPHHHDPHHNSKQPIQLKDYHQPSQQQQQRRQVRPLNNSNSSDESDDGLLVVPSQARGRLPMSVAEQMKQQANTFVHIYGSSDKQHTSKHQRSSSGRNQKPNLQVRRTLRVKIKKSKPILGIAIEGGYNVSGQLLPRIVCVHEDGAAYLCGKLRASDLILEVNGKSTVNMTHHEIAKTIATAYYQDPRSHIEFLIGESIHV